jgi:NAD kinase
MPDIHCFIVTEILDHNTATPSVIVKDSTTVSIQINDFRKRSEILLKDGTPVDMVLFVDGTIVNKIEKNDRIVIRRTPSPVSIIELEKNYFFKSLHQKFTFR